MSKTLYLVTGAMGYLGNTIISKLAAQGKLIRGLALPNGQHHFIYTAKCRNCSWRCLR